jgi:hypothetical protein
MMAMYLKLILLGILWCIRITAVDAQNTDGSFLDVTVDTPTPYIGQPVIYTWQLFLPAGMNAEAAQITLPTFTGFGQENLPPSEVQLQTINGQSMQVVQRQIVLYPLQTGTFTLEPLRILLPETPFQAAMTLESVPITMTVLPLPVDAPASFQNAIGQFDVVATLNATSMAIGQPIILTLTVTGTGNIQQILRPKIVLPELWRIFEQQNPTQSISPVFGSRVFEWQLIPTQAGIHVLPAIEFSFLNPQSGVYEIRNTTPLPIEVLADANAATLPPTPQPATPDSTLKPDIRLKTIPENIVPTQTNSLDLGIVFWLLPPLLTGILALLTVARSRPTPTPKPQSISGSRALQQAQMQLKTALSQPPKEASVIIAEVILLYISRKTGQSVQREKIKNEIQSLPESLQKSLLDCLNHADAGRYAPVSEQDIKLLLRDTLRVLMEIDKTWQS